MEGSVSPHPLAFLFCHFFLAETCIKLNTEKGQFLKRTGGDAWNYRNRVRNRCKYLPLLQQQSKHLACLWQQGMDVPTSYHKVSVLPRPFLCSTARQKKAHGSLITFTFALLKCFSTPVHMAAIFLRIFLATGWSLRDIWHHCFPTAEQDGGVGSWGWEGRTSFQSLEYDFIPLMLELPEHKNTLSLVQLSFIWWMLTMYMYNFFFIGTENQLWLPKNKFWQCSEMHLNLNFLCFMFSSKSFWHCHLYLSEMGGKIKKIIPKPVECTKCRPATIWGPSSWVVERPKI